MRIDDNSRVQDVYEHPVGRDVIDKVFLQLAKPSWLVDNALVGSLRLGTVRKLLSKVVTEDFWDTLYWLLDNEPDLPSDKNPDPSRPWWKEAVFYQIYPRSFCDSNGDGIGDLGGIISKLDYLQALGVDALWLSPIYDSPNDDNGYDIRDYHAIMAEMGTMEDFDRLLAGVHARGMRLIMDLVVNHTSDEHAWFRNALADPEGPYGQYYFLRRGDAETPPNNWVSFFSGPAWRWFPEQERWALHLFSAKQMDLNWEHAPLRQDIAEMVRWWLAKGVDGFRLDVINYISKREGLPNGNAMIGSLMQYYGIENYFYGPRLHRHLRELRREAFDPYGAFSVGETPGVGLEMGRLLTGQDRGELDLVFNFDHLETPGHVRFDHYRYDLNYLKKYYMKYHRRLGSNDWMSVFLDNHDNPRMLSKVNPDPRRRERLAKLLVTLQLTMKGTPFLFQGQELGAVNQDFTDISQLRDVESLNFFAERKNQQGTEEAWGSVLAGTRDHARVPMLWTAGDNGGFSSVEPWLCRPAPDPGWSAAEQEADEHSVLCYTRQLLALRHAHHVLRFGNIRFVAGNKRDYFAYFREEKGKRIFCEFNLSDKAILRPFTSRKYRVLLGNVSHGRVKRMDRLGDRMEPYEAVIYEI